MSDFKQTERILRILKLISSPKNNYSKEKLSKQMNVTVRTIERDLEILENLEIYTEVDKYSKALRVTTPFLKSHFELKDNEVDTLSELLEALEDANPLKDSLKQKLGLWNNYFQNSKDVINLSLAQKIEQLQRAIHDKKRVKLIGYQTAESGTVPHDRLVEPIELMTYNAQLSAWDVDKNMHRCFKLKRIQDLEVLSEDVSLLLSNPVYPADLFGIVGPHTIWVTLQLSNRAYKLLCEEYRDAIPMIETIEKGKQYKFRIEVRGFEGISRFILGLADEIKVEEPLELKEFINKKVKNFSLRHSLSE